MITVELDAAEVRRALQRLEESARDLQPVLRAIGELLVESTKERFRGGVGPDGSPWPPNRPSTVLAQLRRRAGADTLRRGEAAPRVAAGSAGKRPLIGESRRLSSEIAYEVGPDQVAIGSSLVYAATQQFGAPRGAFGRTRRGAPIPWGDVPPRPFLGLSAVDDRSVVDAVEHVLASSLDEGSGP